MYIQHIRSQLTELTQVHLVQLGGSHIQDLLHEFGELSLLRVQTKYAWALAHGRQTTTYDLCFSSARRRV